MADTMQDDALRRLKQMYSKASSDTQGFTQPSVSNNSHSGHNTNGSHNGHKSSVDTTYDNQSTDSFEKKTEDEKKTQQKPSVHNENSNYSVLDIFMRDKEKSLIILLIVILMSEKADTTLILALMYLVI